VIDGLFGTKRAKRAIQPGVCSISITVEKLLGSGKHLAA
jgi:hypothetical protein